MTLIKKLERGNTFDLTDRDGTITYLVTSVDDVSIEAFKINTSTGEMYKVCYFHTHTLLQRLNDDYTKKIKKACG